MENEIKDLLSEFNKVTDQIIDLKEVGVVSHPAIQLHEILLEQIAKFFNSNVEYIVHPQLGLFESLGGYNGTKETLSPTSIWKGYRRR